jgi:hypothetical protein
MAGLQFLQKYIGELLNEIVFQIQNWTELLPFNCALKQQHPCLFFIPLHMSGFFYYKL